MIEPRDDRRALRRALPGHVGLGLVFALAVAAAAHASSAPDAPLEGLTCNEQKPLPFLVRGNYTIQDGLPPEERKTRAEMQTRALRFRTERYGRSWGTAPLEWNERAVADYIEQVRFLGLPVQVNRKIVPALRCVEQAIAARCGDTPYEAKRLLGVRGKNTFHNGEVSNHLYGIAIDIDPERNPCCRCVEPFPDHPACRKQGATAYERAELPRCWVETFERFGFYWLGHDKLEDTMHFEFLGDPDRITSTP
ncbi:M15 family metallopeptidase [Polyangium sp. y55x31]|uniref:M15 family metallopeptidase n=1 Tax=Polyangium sp. y55x31 TaxID=3042688 RepID=UPI002482BD12|nr:M15 family metallopeptidase [Polyangium sp. y55x31]MDI1479488.1 M15 family metallopeptidase [Polyangium sp. y55x31]